MRFIQHMQRLFVIAVLLGPQLNSHATTESGMNHADDISMYKPQRSEVTNETRLTAEYSGYAPGPYDARETSEMITDTAYDLMTFIDEFSNISSLDVEFTRFKVTTAVRNEEIITEKNNDQTLSYKLNEFIVPILLFVGFFGNSMGIVVMQRKVFEKHCISLIITALAMSDNIVLCLIPFNKKFVIDWLEYDIRSFDAVSCKVFFWFWRTSKLTSSWFVALIGLERFIAVWLPLKARDLITRKSILTAIMLNYVIIGGFNFMWGFITDSVIDGKCQPNQRADNNVVVEGVLAIIGGSMYSIIPGLFIFALNILTIWKLTQEEKRRNKMVDNLKFSAETSKITFMLLSISIAFLVLVVPVSGANLFAIFTGKSDLYTSTEPTVVLFKEITQTMEQLNYSINFFLYTLCSSMFRKEVWAALHCKGYHAKHKYTKNKASSTL